MNVLHTSARIEVGRPPSATVTVPQFADKHDHRSVVDPADGLPDEPAPSAVVVCYQDRLFERVCEERAVEPCWPDVGFFELRRLANRPEIGVLGKFGTGAPVTAMALEDVVADVVDALGTALDAEGRRRRATLAEVQQGETELLTPLHFAGAQMTATADRVHDADTIVESATAPDRFPDLYQRAAAETGARRLDGDRLAALTSAVPAS